MQKDPSKGYLFFTKKEKRGTLFILAVILLVFLSAKYIYPLVLKDNPPSSETALAVNTLKERHAQEKERNDLSYEKNYPTKTAYHSYEKTSYENNSPGELFSFDPNTLDEAGWKRLGVRDKTVATIKNYLSKGGKFREADDIKKIWGLSDAEKERLVPYAHIAAPANAQPAYQNNYQPYEKKTFEKKQPVSVDINSGDSTAFVGLPGIGPGYSKRIISFRDKLGGFYKIEQVGEVFGLPDSVFQKIKPLLKISGALRKININTATLEELKAHPYIRWQLANVITEYRKQHGDFQSLSDLKKIMTIDDATYQKILPYLVL